MEVIGRDMTELLRPKARERFVEFGHAGNGNVWKFRKFGKLC